MSDITSSGKFEKKLFRLERWGERTICGHISKPLKKEYFEKLSLKKLTLLKLH